MEWSKEEAVFDCGGEGEQEAVSLGKGREGDGGI
jgi:hypothetical protein